MTSLRIIGTLKKAFARTISRKTLQETPSATDNHINFLLFQKKNTPI
jgi:hypothetical protein